MAVESIALRLVAQIYDAALAPEKWAAFLGSFTQTVNARSAFLRATDQGAGQVRLFESVGYDPTFVAAYRNHFVRHDYFAQTFATMPINVVMRGDEAVPWQRQRNTEFYNDYLRPQGIRHVMGGILARNDRHHLLFATQREATQGEFIDNERHLIQILAPHVARAATIQRQMADVVDQKRWALSALDRLRVGVILLDDDGRPLYLNRKADYLASIGKGFVARHDGIALPSAADTARLRSLIADAIRLASGKGGDAGGCLRVRMGEDGGILVQFQVIPLPRDLSERPWREATCKGCVAVFVSASGGPRLPSERIAAMHGLTRAEARLASILADGMSLEAASDVLLVSVATLRSHLKSIFAKTGVTRQAELVALLLADMLHDQLDATP